MLSSYLNEIYDINKKYLLSNKININSKFLDDQLDNQPKPSNYFDELNLKDNMKLSKDATLNLY